MRVCFGEQFIVLLRLIIIIIHNFVCICFRQCAWIFTLFTSFSLMENIQVKIQKKKFNVVHKCELIWHASIHLDRSVLDEKSSNPIQLVSVYTGQTAVLIKQPTDWPTQPINQPTHTSIIHPVKPNIGTALTSSS